MGFSGTLATLPNFLAYFIVGGALTGLFLVLYSHLTPHREIALIRNGNSAAAVALVGGLLGFMVPLASVIAHSAAIVELVAWGIIALVVQLGGFLTARAVLPHLPQAIEAGNIADAVFLAGLSLALGILDAACMAG